MDPYFFYGTLRSLPVLETVIGRPSSGLVFQEAFVPHSELRLVMNESFPVIIFDPKYKGIQGTIVKGFSNEDISRILFFEDVGFIPQKLVAKVEEKNVEAKYFSQKGVRPSGESWSFEKWKNNDEKLSILTTELWMNLYGKYSAEEADQYWVDIKNKAILQFQSK